MRFPSRLYYRIVPGLVGAAIALAVSVFSVGAAETTSPFNLDDASLEEAIPIQRILLPRDRLAAELDRVRQGALVELTRAEFEKRVRKAALGARRRLAVPRLIETHYRARLLNDGLDENSFVGTAEWKIVNDGAGPGLLSLDAMQIALRQARWTDNRSAVIGLLEPTPQPGLALLVDMTGEQSLALDWTSRGVPEPGQLRFDLRVPVSPIATLEIEVPGGLRPFFPQDEVVLIEAPVADPGAKRQIWRVAFGGISHLEILLRLTNPPDHSPAPIQAASLTRQELTPGMVLQQSTLDWNSLRGEVTELLIEHDPELSISDVNIVNLESWRPLLASVNGKKRVRVRLSEPMRGGQLSVSATAALPFNESTVWTSPTLAIVGAIPRGETIRLRINPDLNIQEWKTGAFQLIKNEFLADRSQILTLESALLPDAAPVGVRPSARLRYGGVEYHVHQHFDWEVAADQSNLVARLKLEVVRGSLKQLVLRVPAGWDVDGVEADAKDLALVWSSPTGAPPTMHVEFQKPVASGTLAELVIRLSRFLPAFNRTGPLTMPFPVVLPVGARLRQGEYVVRVGPAFQASAPEPPSESESVGPPLPPTAGASSVWTYRFYGQPPAGPLSLRPSVVRFTANIDNAIAIASDGAENRLTLSLKPDTGASSSLVIATSEPIAPPWNWRTVQGSNQVIAVDPLPIGPFLAAIGSRSPLASLAIVQDRSRYRWWRLTLARPLDSPLVLQSIVGAAPRHVSVDEQCRRALLALASRAPLSVVSAWAADRLAPAPKESSPYIPLLQVPGARIETGTVIVRMPPERQRILETFGLVRDPVPISDDPRSETYHYEHNPVSLRAGNAVRHDESTRRIDGAELVTVVDLGAHHTCWFRFRLRNGGAPSLPIRLPANAEILAVAVGGQVLPAESCLIAAPAEQKVCTVPIPATPDWQQVEVLYSVPAPDWAISTRLAPALPQLPITPAVIHYVWRLVPGVAPVSNDGLTRQPGGALRDRPLMFPWTPEMEGEPVDDAKKAGPRDSSGKIAPTISKTSMAPPRTFQQLVLGASNLAQKPIIDLLALEEAEILPATPISGATFESLGLELVPFPGGNVLTTARQHSIWRVDMPGTALPASIGAAVRQAIHGGRDNSGRFRTVDDWLETASACRECLLSRLGGDGPGWTSWAIQKPGATPAIRLVRTSRVAAIGWLAAAILAGAGIVFIGRLGRLGVCLLLSWLFASSAAVVGLPPALGGLAVGPFLAALMVAILAACFRQPVRPEARTVVAHSSSYGRGSRKGAATAGILILLAAPLPAAAPGPAVAYLLPGTEANPEPVRVLVPPELLDRLALLAEPKLALSEAVLLRARCAGRGDESGTAEFDAHFDVASFIDNATLVLPLGETRFREVLLDGAAAFPRPVGGDRVAIEIKEKGEHRLDVKFAVTFLGNGPDRELRFGIPELAACQLDFTAPPGAEHVRAVNWRGAQTYDEASRTLHADLGRSRSVHVRWQQGGNAGIAQVRVAESSVWDIELAAATLYTVFDYKITQGAVTELKIVLPPNVDVSRLEVRPETVPVGAPPMWVRRWSVGSNRVLSVDLQAALTGSVRLLLECVPTRRFTDRPILQAPSPLEVAESEAFIGFRLHGLEAIGDIERRGVSDYSADAFLKETWRNLGAEKSPAPLTRVFRRGKSEQPFLRPSLRPSPTGGRANQELIWWLDRHGAQVECTAHWAASGAPLTFVEWELPVSVQLHDVRGLAVQSWLRSGNRVFVWLKEPAAETTIRWNGSLTHSFSAADTMVFEAPAVKLDAAASPATVLRLRVPDDFVVSAENVSALGVMVAPLADREFSIKLARPNLPARFQVRGPQLDGSFQVSTAAEVVDRRLHLDTAIEPALRRDRPHSFAVSIQHVQGWEVEWQLPPGYVLTQKTSGVDNREFVVDVSPRDGDPVPLVFRFRRNLDTKRELALPEFTVKSGIASNRIRQAILLIGPEVRMMETSGYRRETAPRGNNLKFDPVQLKGFQERGGSVWQAEHEGARAWVKASPVTLDAAPAVRVALADLEAAARDDRWAYRATFHLWHEAGASLRAEFPSGTTFDGWAIDGVMQPLPAEAAGFNFVLPAEAGARLVQMVWSVPGPVWEPPQLLNAGRRVNLETLVWTALPRTGQRIKVAEPLSAAQLDLRRAECLLKYSSDNAAGLGEANLARLVSRATRWIRLAEANLAGPRGFDRPEERSPGGLTLTEWSARLLEQVSSLRPSRAREPSALAGPSLREETFAQMPYADAFVRGIPVRWASQGEEIRVQPDAAGFPLPELASFSLIALAVTSLGLLILVVGRVTRPEQIMVIGLLGIAVFGMPVGYCFIPIIALALLVRLGGTSTRVLRWVGG